MEDHIRNSTTTQYKAIFPETLNANETLFGGQAMKWMDEVAYITATRFARERMFTVTVEKINFLKAIHPGSIAVITGRIEKVKLLKVYVLVDVYVEEMYGQNREKAIEGTFIFTAVDEQNKPKKITLK